MEGWSWATLDGFVDLGELDELLAGTAGEVAAPGLAFSVHDSDTVYLAGADASGIRFRLVINPDVWEDDLPRQEIDGAVAWSRDHAPVCPSSNEIADVLGTDFAFAEEGLDLLLARMGLLQADSDTDGSEFQSPVPSPADFWLTFEPVDTPKTRILEGGRWHTTLHHGGVSARVLAAEESPEALVSAYGVQRGAPIIHFGKAQTRAELWNEATSQGITLGQWEDVPESVPRDLASTCAWLLGG